MTLDEVATELYGLLPEEFTERRDTLAKEVRAAGDRALAARIGKLRKPRRTGWVLNLLVRRHPGEVDRLMGVGVGLREAQRNGAGEDLRALDQQRRELTGDLARQARAIGAELDRELSDELVAEVENTLRTAMADPAGSAALRSGLLLDGFGASGFEPLDMERVVAVPEAVPDSEPEPPRGLRPVTAPSRSPKQPTTKKQQAAKPRRETRTAPSATTAAKQPAKTKRPGTEPRPDDAAARARQQADEALDTARRTLEQAAESADRASQQLTDAAEARRSIEDERSALQDRLRTLDHDLARAHRAEDRAGRASANAERQRADAQREVDRAERRARPG